MEYVARKSNLVVPEGFVELDREEMTYVDGGDYYIDNSMCTNIIGVVFAGIYVGGVTLAAAIMCGMVTKAALSGMVYSLIGHITSINVFLGGLLAVIGKFAVEVLFNMTIASFSGKGVSLETIKIWGWDTGIPVGVSTY